MNNKEEIFYLRDTIIRYKEKLKNNGKRDAAKINLYNLNSHDMKGIQGDSRHSSFVDAWEVVLKDFKITQNKDKPFVYNYSIDFTGIRLLGSSKITTRTESGLTKGVDKKLNFLQASLKSIETWYGLSEDVKNAVRDVRAAVNRYASEVERYLAMTTGSIENYFQAGSDAVGIVTDVYDSFKRITMAPADSALRIVDTLKYLREKCEAVVTDIKSLPDQWDERYEEAGDAIQSEIDAYKRYFGDTMQDAENTGNAIYAETASGSNPMATVVPKVDSTVAATGSGDTESGSADGSGNGGESAGIASPGITMNVVVSYGYMRHIANSLTSLEKLAEMYLGDPDKAQTIALINKITGDDEIKPGDQIKIPVLNQNTMNTMNKIFGPANIRDTLGIDIAIENGIFQVGPNGDFIVKTDYENMNQAINSRLSESLGNRLRLSTYGIRNVAGTPDAIAAAYIATSIKDTVMQDPRVERVEDLYFKGSGDSLLVSFSYYTHDGILHRYKGGI
jgi:predicted transcriptional regulator